MSPPGFYGDSGDGCDNDDEVPHHFHFESTEPDEMFRHFENMFRSFDELFRSMGMAQFSAIEPGVCNLSLEHFIIIIIISII